MRQRQELPFPEGGRSDDTSPGKQTALTTREGSNVVVVDPTTGESRGSQRGGFTALTQTAAGTGKIQHGFLAPYRVPLIDYTALGTGTIREEWGETTRGEGSVVAIATDGDGNVIALESNGGVVVNNPGGEDYDFFSVPTQTTDEIVRRVEVDVFNDVYIAASIGPDMDTGRLWKFSKGEDGYVVVWSVDVAGQIQDFRLGPAVMYMIADYEEEATSEDRSRLIQIGSIYAGLPAVVWEKNVPFPANGLDVGNNGSAYTTHDANQARGFIPDGGGYTQISDLLSPHEMSAADERLYSWIDAVTLEGYADGDAVRDFPDRRDVQTGVANVHDDTDRLLRRKSSAGWRPPPAYRATAWGTLPAVEFKPDGEGEVLASRQNTDGTPKQDVEDKLPNSKAILPAPDEHRWIYTFLVKLEEDDEMRVVWSQNNEPRAYFGVVNNADGTVANGAPDPQLSQGSLAFFAPANDVNGGGGQELASYDWRNDWDGTTGPNPNETQSVLVSIVWNGLYHAVDNPNLCYIRCNGVVINEFEATRGGFWNSGTSLRHTIFGSKSASNHQPGTTLFHDPVRNGDFLLQEGLVMLSTSSADSAPHDQAASIYTGQVMTNPYVPGDVITDSADSTGSGGWLNAYDVEVLEGIIAHRKGVSHLLPNDSAVIGQRHPFGGPTRPPVSTSPLNGVYVPIDTGTLASPRPILAKWGPSQGELQWAVDGPGFGYGVAVDENNDVITIGPWINEGPTDNILVRKTVDRGTSVKPNVRSRGSIRYNANVSVNDTNFIIDDGWHPAVTFQFDTDGTPVTETDTLKSIDAQTNRSTTVQNTLIAITAAVQSDDLSVLVAHNGNDVLLERNLGLDPTTDPPVGYPEVLITTTSTDVEVTGFEGEDLEVDAWEYSGPASEGMVEEYPRVLTDPAGNFYVPVATASKTEHVDRYAAHGDDIGGAIKDWRYTVSQTGITDRFQALSIGFDPEVPDYEDDTITGPRYMYVGTDSTVNSDNFGTAYNLRKLELVAGARSGADSPRAQSEMVIVDGDLKERVGDTFVTIAAGEFDATARTIQSTYAYGEIFIADGKVPKVYDPKEKTVEVYRPTTSGSIPYGPRWVATWRGRVVWSGFAQDPHNWVMSAIQDPYDMDFDPVPPRPDQAVAAVSSRVGRLPWAITGLIPYNDDLLFFLTDSQIFRLTGDPASGGQLDLVSDIVGGAPGTAWAKDREGRVFLRDSRGGITMMLPSGEMRRLTVDRIERAMSEVDMSLYLLRLEWNAEAEGLFVFQVPYGAGGVPVQGWFWESKGGTVDAWWDVTFSSTDLQPTAVWTLDGDDPDDRRMVIGCEDSRLRYLDRTATDDDGYRIESSVLVGPISSESLGREVKWSSLEVVLSGAKSGCDYEVFCSNDPSDMGQSAFSGHLEAGRNPRVLSRCRGVYVWLRLLNGALGESWALEYAGMEVWAAGRTRARR